MNRLKMLIRVVVACTTLFQVFSVDNSAFSEGLPLVKTFDGGQLEYRIALSKPVYLIYEQVMGNVRVKNLSQKTVKIDFRAGTVWIIRDKYGKHYPPNFHDTYVASEIKPGDSIGGSVSLEGGYGVTLSIGTFPYFAFPVGEYTVYYKIKEDSLGPLTFRVVEPTSEDAEALKMFLEAYSYLQMEKIASATQDEKTELFRKNVEKLEEIANRYPRSKYTPQILIQAATTAWNILNDKEHCYQMTRRVIEDYPEMGAGLLHILRSYYKAKRDMPAYKRELEKIIERNADLNLIAAAKEAARKLESEE